MFGILSAVSDLVTHGAMRDAVWALVPEGTEDLNLSAFDKGCAYGHEHSGRKGK
jgi:Pyruvate/2-oxoacid:ferredoxin oxidoreductase gamma subunit